MQIPEKEGKLQEQMPATLPVTTMKKTLKKKKEYKNDNTNTQHSTRGTGLIAGCTNTSTTIDGIMYTLQSDIHLDRVLKKSLYCFYYIDTSNCHKTPLKLDKRLTTSRDQLSYIRKIYIVYIYCDGYYINIDFHFFHL